jgi:cysteine desulfurase / selenocysteine lyase
MGLLVAAAAPTAAGGEEREQREKNEEPTHSGPRVAGYHGPMAVTTGRKSLDAHALRADFPIFEQLIHGKPLAYLDSANSSQKPRQVIDAMSTFYETSYANVHRAVHVLGERATAGLEGAREKVRAFVNAPDVREIIFVRNATEAINLVAYAWGGNNLGPGDAVVVTELEHHSNFVPWQYIARRNGAEFVMLPLDDNLEVDLSGLESIARDYNVKVVATNLVSNSLGTIADIGPLTRWAREQGAIFVCDAAQAAPHMRVDVQALDCDFLAISGHKMCGPSGIGALWGRGEILRAMEPFMLGGHMISSVRYEKTTWGELPHKFEAGTAPIAEAVGLGAAVDYLEAAGPDAIEAHEHELAAYALERLAEVPDIALYGLPAERRAGVVSFNLGDIHPHDVAQILDRQGVAIRAGHHCCQPLMHRLGVAATNRASFYLYTVPEEIDQLVAGLHTVRKVFA